MVRKDQDGIASRAGTLFNDILGMITARQGLDQFPLKLEHVLPFIDGGSDLLESSRSADKFQVLANNALVGARAAGKKNKAGLVGILARNAKGGGTFPAKRLAVLTATTANWVRRQKRKAIAGESGFFESGGEGSRHRKAAQRMPELEINSTRAWMVGENPARSGDQKQICWMSQHKTDFYNEKYRSVSGLVAILEHALEEDPGLRTLVAHEATNKWNRNLKTYLDAAAAYALDDLVIHDERQYKPLNIEEIVECMDTNEEDASASDGSETDEDQSQEELEDLTADHAKKKTTTPPQVRVLFARSQRSFYKTILKGMRLRQRPPDNHCERCAKYEKNSARLHELTAALLSNANDPEHKKQKKVIKRAGGMNSAWEEQRSLQHAMPDLKKHVLWKEETRGCLMNLAKNMGPHETMWQMDYGGFTDSANKKVSVWSVTVLAPGREQEHFDFFFDQAQSKDDDTNAKKNGQSGIYFLREMLDPTRLQGELAILDGSNPSSAGTCRFGYFYNECTHIILSGDTGNGYRAYEMLEELSTVHAKYAYFVKLMPLAPAHAWNRTDARIARMNEMLRIAKAKTRIFGAKGMANLFYAASHHKSSKAKKHVARCHIFFRKPVFDKAAAQEKKKNLGAHLRTSELWNGHIGVRGLLSFDFAVLDQNGKKHHPAGYATVREHTDAKREGNKPFVYTWRKDLSKLICQPCSDRHGGPVLLSAAGCTKQICKVTKDSAATSKAQAANQAAKPQLALCSKEDVKGEERARQQRKPRPRGRPRKDPTTSSNKKRAPAAKGMAKQAGATQTTENKFQVRAVRYEDGAKPGQWQTWLYIPSAWRGRKSKAALCEEERKGQFLYAHEDNARCYVVAAHAETIESGRIDFLILDDIVFTDTVQVWYQCCSCICWTVIMHGDFIYTYTHTNTCAHTQTVPNIHAHAHTHAQAQAHTHTSHAHQQIST